MHLRLRIRGENVWEEDDPIQGLSVDARSLPTFLNFANQIAHPDADDGGWDNMLSDGDERSFLLTGIVLKILDAHVFQHMCFGATQDYVDMLHKQDSSYANVEGKCEIVLTID